MGEYTGRRRGRAASEPSAQQPEYTYTEDPYSGQGYADPYAQPAPEYQGYEALYGYEAAPSYEQYPSYEQQQGYYQGQEYQEPYYQQGYVDDSYSQQSYAEPYYEQPYYEAPYEQQAYGTPGQAAYDYRESGYSDSGYSDSGYGEPSYEADYAAAPPYADYPQHAEYEYQEYTEYSEYPEYPEYAEYPSDTYAAPHPEPAQTSRTPHPPLSHLPYTAAATAALAVAAFVSTTAVAAVVLPLQLVVAWAVLDLTGFASRRTAVLAALPALAGTVATFKFQPDDAVLPIAAGLGAGFVLVAADAVFRARKHGVEPGSVRSLAAGSSALLFAGLTGLFLPAAVLHGASVAFGAAVCGFVALVAARNRELAVSRAAVVAIPVTIAALASYAAAILVP